MPPSADEIAAYSGLHRAVVAGDLAEIDSLIDRGADLAARDSGGRTALHVAGHLARHDAARALLRRGADPNALDDRRYDLVTITAVRDDAAMVALALAAGANPRAVTSPYDGTALIAAAHLGHVEPVRALIAAGAPLDHVNNLGWTALIEAIVLGDGGPRHDAIVELLIAAGADLNLADRAGITPLSLARRYGFTAIAERLARAGAR